MSDEDSCPNSKTAKHYFDTVVSVKSDFEPTELGQSVQDTTYKRVEYTVMACSCGLASKQKVRMAA